MVDQQEQFETFASRADQKLLKLMSESFFHAMCHQLVASVEPLIARNDSFEGWFAYTFFASNTLPMRISILCYSMGTMVGAQINSIYL